MMGSSLIIVYKSTLIHGNTDGLSQLPLPDSKDDTVVSSKETDFQFITDTSIASHSNTIEISRRNDPVLRKVLTYTRNEWPQIIPNELKPLVQGVKN